MVLQLGAAAAGVTHLEGRCGRSATNGAVNGGSRQPAPPPSAGPANPTAPPPSHSMRCSCYPLQVDPELLATFDKLGIPLNEQKRLANVAVDAVFDSVSIATTFKDELKKVRWAVPAALDAVTSSGWLVATLLPPGATLPCLVASAPGLHDINGTRSAATLPRPAGSAPGLHGIKGNRSAANPAPFLPPPLPQAGVIFCSISEAVKEYPDLVRKYMGSVVSSLDLLQPGWGCAWLLLATDCDCFSLLLVLHWDLCPLLANGRRSPRAALQVPVGDNYYAALNSAVFSDGSFVYVPKGVRSPMELSTYFRINASETGQVRGRVACGSFSRVAGIAAWKPSGLVGGTQPRRRDCALCRFVPTEGTVPTSTACSVCLPQFERTLIVAEEGAYVSYLEVGTAWLKCC